ncbi:hypothetical protein FOA52_002205 [Chlamydomonas sp. UWO 241]|nr:hypothetical protein FOA52_002205 [Chlamydomonas sp. UWO 241]
MASAEPTGGMPVSALGSLTSETGPREHGEEEEESHSSDWTLVESGDCSSERSFAPPEDPGSPRSDIAADLVLAQPLPHADDPTASAGLCVPPAVSPADASPVECEGNAASAAATVPSSPAKRPTLPPRARDFSLHIPNFLGDLTPGAFVAAAASMWMGIARAWLSSVRVCVCDAAAVAAGVAASASADARAEARELARALRCAACAAGGALEAVLGSGKVYAQLAHSAAGAKAALLKGRLAKVSEASSVTRPMPLWLLLSMGIATATSLAGVVVVIATNRSLSSQLRQRDRELAHLVLSIVNLQEALQSSRASVPLLRHVALTPAFTVSSFA